MNPLLASFLGAIIRHLLTAAGTWFVGHGILEEGQMHEYVLGGTALIIGLLWTFWNKYKGRIHFLTALQAGPNTSEDQVKAIAKIDPPVSMAKVMGVLLAVGLATSCAAKQDARHTAVQVDTTVATAIFAIQDAEKVLYQAGLIQPAQHQSFNAALVPLLETGQKFNRAIRAWDQSQPLPKEVRALAPQFKALLDHVVQSFVADEKVKASLLEKISLAQAAVLAALYFLPQGV